MNDLLLVTIYGILIARHQYDRFDTASFDAGHPTTIQYHAVIFNFCTGPIPDQE